MQGDHPVKIKEPLGINFLLEGVDRAAKRFERWLQRRGGTDRLSERLAVFEIKIPVLNSIKLGELSRRDVKIFSACKRSLFRHPPSSMSKRIFKWKTAEELSID